MTRKLTKALEDQKKGTEQHVGAISGLLGIPLNGQRRIEVAGRNSYVYVRLRSNQSEVIQAYNNKVAASYGLPVLVERHGNKYVVVGVDSQRYENNWNSQAPFLPRHGNAHSFDTESGGGGDIVWVYPRQITPILVMPSGSSGAGNVIVNPYTLKKNDNSWRYVGNTGTASLIQHNPTSPTGAIMALVYLDESSGNPLLLINSGTVFSNTITGSSQVFQYIPTITNPATQIPLAAIRLITGTNAISWDNIYDVRQFIHTIPTGSSGGGLSSIPIYNSGSFVGNASQFDFQHPLKAGFTGTTAYPYLDGSLLAIEDVTGQLISGSAVNHFNLTGTVQLGTDRLFYNGLRQQRISHYTVDADGGGFTTLFTGTFGDVLTMEYGNLGTQANLPSSINDLYGSRGLQGRNNSTGSASSFDVSAIKVLLWRPSDSSTVIRTATGTISCNKDLVGANGRDQASAFSANSFLHLYYIWDGQNLSTLFSLSSPITGPTLPNGYTYWCYVATIPMLGSNLDSMRLRGNTVYYISSAEILNGGQATSSTEVAVTSKVPSIANNIEIFAYATAEDFVGFKIGIGSTNVTVQEYFVPPIGAETFSTSGHRIRHPNESVYYAWSAAATGRLLYLDVLSYEVPNGAC